MDPHLTMNDLGALPATRGRDRARGGVALVFNALRAEIISLALAPGTVLSRAELQGRFGLSSTPIRDALLRLEEEGLVDVFPQHATVVTPIDLTQARQGQFLRRSIEMEVARTLARRPDRGVTEAARALIRRQVAFAELEDHAAFNETDQAFHQMLCSAAAVGELWQVVQRHSGHLDRLRRLNLPVAGKMRGVIADHEAIVAAIEAGDPAAAGDRVRDHLSRSLESVTILRDRHPDYFRR